MPTFTSAIQALSNAGRQHPPNLQAVFAAANAVNATVATTPLAERNAALTQLSEIIADEHPVVAGVVAVVCGAIIEHGANVDIPAEAILTKATTIFGKARQYAEACAIVSMQPADEETLQRFGPKMPAAVDCWQAIDFMYRAVVALTSRSAQARSQISDSLKQDAEAMREVNQGAYWLHKMFEILFDEIIIVLHPEQQRGYKLRIGGIADNFQLHSLLADTLIGDPEQGWLEGAKPNAEVSAIMRGTAPNDAGITATGSFNLYDYRALGENGTLPDELNTAYWIWGEGIPTDIPTLDDTRIILLGKPPYARTWNAQRMFNGLHAEIDVLETFDAETYQHWVQHILAH